MELFLRVAPWMSMLAVEQKCATLGYVGISASRKWTATMEALVKTRANALVLGLGLVSVLGCGADVAEIDTAADIQAINEIREREFAAFSSGAVDELVALFSSDAVVMPPEAPAASGEAGVRAWAQGMADQFTIDGGYTSSEVTVIGDWAVERYTGDLELTASGGESMTLPVKGIHVYRRQSDGSWLITQDVWNTDAPATAAP